MGQTNPQYPVFEVALACEHRGNAGLHERKTVGDIIAIRKPSSGIGAKEVSKYLWLRLEGLEENQMHRLVDSIDGFDKRRYQIPLERLVSIVPSLNLARIKDLSDKYQPFLGIDEESLRFVSIGRPLNVHGLVWDKATGRYL